MLFPLLKSSTLILTTHCDLLSRFARRACMYYSNVTLTVNQNNQKYALPCPSANTSVASSNIFIAIGSVWRVRAPATNSLLLKTVLCLRRVAPLIHVLQWISNCSRVDLSQSVQGTKGSSSPFSFNTQSQPWEVHCIRPLRISIGVLFD